MSIKDFIEKIKSFRGNLKDKFYSSDNGLKIKDDLFVAILIIFVGIISFGLGKLSNLEKKNVEDIPLANIPSSATVALSNPNSVSNKIVSNSTTSVQKGIVVASKNGTRYYYPNCSGVSKIKEENKVWFNSIKDAEIIGLILASGCSANN